MIISTFRTRTVEINESRYDIMDFDGSLKLSDSLSKTATSTNINSFLIRLYQITFWFPISVMLVSNLYIINKLQYNTDDIIYQFIIINE